MKVSVIIPVYNAEKYFSEALDSILAQTFTDFEVLLIDDSSTDSSPSLMVKYAKQDKRIKVLQNQLSKGVAGALNTGIHNAQGEYIARMDADDISLPERFAKQVAFLDKHPEIGLCGTWYELIGNASGVKQLPTDPAEIQATMLFQGALAHPSVMIRHSVLVDNKLEYNPIYDYGQDLDLWVRMAKVTKLTNIPEVLLNYRVHGTSVGGKHSRSQGQTANKIRYKQLVDLGIFPNYTERNVHESLSNWHYGDPKKLLKDTDAWITKLKSANNKQHIYQEPVFSQILAKKWLEVYDANPSLYAGRRYAIKHTINKLRVKSGLFCLLTNIGIPARPADPKSMKVLNNPKVSVVMAAYNAEQYIRESIWSVLDQTFVDFEFLIVNDGSTDKTVSIIEDFMSRDKRVKLLQNSGKKGVADAANTGINAAKGEYIARMDSDDVWYLHKLGKQVAFMDAHSEVAASGTWVRVIGQGEGTIWKMPTNPKKIKCQLIFYGVISNPSSILRKSVLNENNIRYQQEVAEDYDLFVRLSKFGDLTNFPEILINYRIHTTNIGVSRRDEQDASANRIRFNQLKELGVSANQKEQQLHTKISNWQISEEKQFLEDARKWFDKLLLANNKSGVYPKDTFAEFMAEKWLDVYRNTHYLGTRLLINYILSQSPSNISLGYRVGFVLRAGKIYVRKVVSKVKSRI